MEVHTTEDVTDLKASTARSWVDGPFFKKMEALRPWLQWGIIIAIAVGGIYIAMRDSSAQQNVNLSELERKTDLLQKTMDERKNARDSELRDLKSSVVTMQLFDERTRAMQKQLDNIVTSQQEILTRLPVRNP